jgi:hypothetical protein
MLNSKKIWSTLIPVFVFIICLYSPAGAEDFSKELKALKKQIEKLESRQSELYHSLREKKSPATTGLAGVLPKSFHFGGLIEVEAMADDNDKDGDSSDITLATVELGLDVDINEYVKGHILMLWEEDATDPIAMDEGTIIFGSPYGLTLTVGKMYVPFGVFSSHFISDPLTLELGETNESAVLVTYAKSIAEFSVGVFNGSADQSSESTIDDWVASLTVTPAEGVTIGASYISDISDTDADLTGLSRIRHRTPGVGGFVTVTYGKFNLIGEYIGATKRFHVLDLDADGSGSGDKPRTYNLELAYQLNERTELAARYEGNDDMPGFVQWQYGGVVSYALYENVTIAAEFLHGEFDNATNDEKNTATIQAAIGF